MAESAADLPALHFEAPEVEAWLRRFSADVEAAGGRALLVGGCVRDAALGQKLREVDVEVFGLAPDVLQRCAAALGPLREVGREFPILKIARLPIDVSLPRRGRPPSGADFARDADPQQSVDEALARRDFTINAMALDLRGGRWLDPHGGRADLAARRLRHTSARFSEDPLRVLRAMQLVARFDLVVAPETVELCRTLTPGDAARERRFAEWQKLLLRGRCIARGLAFLEDAGWLRFQPELAALVGCEQDPRWHPEGDVWVHTGHALDAFAAERVGDPHEDLVVGLAVLCHDFGKPATTERDGERVRAHGHEGHGVAPTEHFLARLSESRTLAAEVTVLVANHLAPMHLYRERDKVGDVAIRRLARRVGRIDRLVRVAAADHAGRPPLREPFEAGSWLLARAQVLAVERCAPAALVQGRDLLPLGLAPGPKLGAWLEACYQAQLQGEFTTTGDGVAWVQERWTAGASPPLSSPRE